VKILVIWRLLTVGGVNAGWRNRAIYFKEQGITIDFLYTTDLGGMHMMEDVAKVFLTNDKKEIYQIINNNHYDAIIVVDTSKAYKWLEKTNYKGPILIEARTPEITKLKRNLEGKEKIEPQKFIVPSEYQKRVLSILLDQPIPIEVIHNSIDTSFFRPLKIEEVNLEEGPIIPKDKKVVAYIGRLDHRKNWRLLLKIAERVAKERSDIEFWVIGGNKSSEKQLFEEEWKNNKLTDVVKWYPVIPYHQMPSIYAKIKHSGGCTIATTRQESFGNTFIESMACGVPVIAPSVSSIPEIVINGETGYLYKENYIRGATEHIYRIVDQTHKYERLSDLARKQVENKFSLAQCATKYIEILKEITKGEVNG
jgi:glycosyltransferase involved in cell wall biosynthesis